MTQAPVLVTERLTVRPLQEGDAEFIVALLTDADFLRNVGDRGVKTVDDAREYIRTRAPGQGDHPEYGVYVVVTLDAPGEALGICTLFKRPNLDAPDLGFAFLPAHRSRGYALESARALKDFAFGAGITRLVAIVRADNTASVTLLSRLGFRAESTTRDEAGVELLVYAAGT